MADEHQRSRRESEEDLHALPTKTYVLAELAALEPTRSRTRRGLAAVALELAERLGMAPLVDQVEALLCRLTATPCSPRARPR